MSYGQAEVYPLHVSSLPERQDIARYLELCLPNGWGIFSSRADVATDYTEEPTLVSVCSTEGEAYREAERLTDEFGYSSVDYECGTETYLRYFVNKVALRGVSVEFSVVADYERTE
ncbi:MAG: hypothetical protein U0451_03005 [Candidatus Saccharimonadales bacterium]